MANTQKDLQRCDFCGSANALWMRSKQCTLDSSPHYGKKVYYIECASCGACGPISPLVLQSYRFWNCRRLYRQGDPHRAVVRGMAEILKELQLH